MPLTLVLVIPEKLRPLAGGFLAMKIHSIIFGMALTAMAGGIALARIGRQGLSLSVSSLSVSLNVSLNVSLSDIV